MASAELRLSLKPDPITAETTSAMVIEISSMRLDISVIHPDALRKTDGDTVLDDLLTGTETYDLSSAKQTVVHHYSLGLAADDGRLLAASKDGPKLLTDVDLFSTIKGISESDYLGGAWKADQGGGPPLGPPPEIIFVVELDLPTAKAVIRAMDPVYDELDTGFLTNTLDLVEYQGKAIEWMTTALRASRMLDGKRASNGPFSEVALTPQSMSALGWMYGAALELASRETAAAEARPLAGCKFSAAHRMRRLDGESDNPIERAYGDLITDPVLYNSATLLKTAVEYRELGNVFGRLLLWQNREAAAGFAKWLVVNGKTDFAHSIDYLTAVVATRIDPAVIDIYDCAAILRNRGERMVSATIFERRIAYRRMNAELARFGEAAPKFFSAAETVTHLLGIGSVDALGITDVSPFTTVISGFDDEFLNEMCTELSRDVSILPSSRAQEILRQINFELYASVNLPVHRRLREVPSGASVFALPDPVTGKPIDSDLHPSFAQMAQNALPHDLRMVIAEQSFIEERLPDLVDLKSDEGRKIGEELDRAQSALFCLQLERVFKSQEVNDHLDRVKRTAELMAAAVREEIIAKENAKFGNYLWRVATGTAMVMVIHGADEATYIRYLKEFVEAEKQKGLEKGLEELTPQKKEELREPLKMNVGSLGPSLVGFRRGTEILLAEDFAETEFWGCQNGFVSRSPLDVPGTLTQREQAVVNTGGMVLVLAYELGPDGALDADAAPVANDPANCRAFSTRRARFERAVSALPMPLPNAEASADQPLIVMERAIAMRKAVGRLEPFIRSQAPLTGVDRIVAQIEEVHGTAARFERHVALLTVLGSDTPAPIEGMGLTAEKLTELSKKYAELFEPKGIVLVGDAAKPGSYSDFFSDPARPAKIDAFAIEMAQAFGPLEEAWKENTAVFTPPTLAAGRFPLQPFFPDDRAISLNAGSGLDVGSLAGLGLPGELGANFVADARNRVSADIILRNPSARAPAALGATGGCATPAFESDGKSATEVGCANVSELRDEDTLVESDVQRLGIRILEVSKGSDCADSQLEACALERTDTGSDNVFVDNGAFQRALDRLGVPQFVSFTPTRLDPVTVSADLKDISIRGTLTVAGLRMEHGSTTVQLRNRGEWVNFNAAFVEAATDTMEKELAAKFAEAQSFLSSLRFPADASDSYFRFGPDIDEDGEDGIELSLDWEQAKFDMRMVYALQARRTLETPWEDALALRAGVELVLGPSGMERQHVVFSAPDEDDVMELIAALPIFDRIREASGGVVSVTPEIIRGNVKLRVAARLDTARCPVEFAFSVGLDLDGLEDAFANVGDMLADQAANCAVVELTKGMNSLVADQTVDILGVPFAITVDGDTALAAAMEQQLPLVFTVQETALASDGALGSCEALGTEREVKGIRFSPDPLKFDFRDMDKAGETRLGTMVRCRIERTVPEGLRKYFELKNVAVGQNLLAADIVLKDLPYLGTMALPRQNFSSMDADIGQLLEEVLGAAASQKLGAEIYTHLGGNEGTDLAGIGRVKLVKDTVAVDLFSDDPKVTATAELIVSDIPFKADLEIAFARGADALRVTIDEDATLEAAFAGAIGKVLEFVPEDTIKISNPRFGRLDDHGRVWGFVFSLKATIPTEPGLVVGASRITISEDGVSLGDKITGGASVPIPMGPVALSKVLVTLYTGEDGRQSGVEVGADITAFDATLSHLVKLRALLDLREIDKPKFSATGDLIVLNTLEVFKAKGTLDLSLFRVTMDANTTDLLQDIIDYQSKIDADGSEERFLASSGLSVLGIELNRQELVFCVKECGDDSGREHIAQLIVMKNFLIGKGNVNAVTDLDFRDPKLGAGVELNLFGWSPGRAKFSADVRRVLVGLRFLGFDLQARTPSIKTMTPQLLIDMLKSLFDLSLEDLLKIKPNNISIAVMSGDGSTQTVHDGNAVDGESEAAQESDGTGAEVEIPGDQTGTPPSTENEDGLPPESDNGGGAPRTPWGQTAKANICIKSIGTPGLRTLTDPDVNARYHIWSWLGRGARPRPFDNIQAPSDARPWWRLYTQDAILALCGQVSAELKETVVGTNQLWRRTSPCAEGRPAGYTFQNVAPVSPETDRSAGLDGLINLHSQVACVRDDGWNDDIWASWFFDQDGDGSGGVPTYVVVPRCPWGDWLTEVSSVSQEAASVCAQGVLRIPASEVAPALGAKDLIHADDLYRVNVTHVRPWAEGRGTTEFENGPSFDGHDVTVNGQRYAVHLYKEVEDGGARTWHFTLRHSWSKDDGRAYTDVVPLVLSDTDPLTAFVDRPAVMTRILQLWLEQGSRPQVVAQQGNDYVVLASQSEDDRAGRRETFDWLWQAGTSAPLESRRVSMSLQLPVPGSAHILSPGPGRAKRAILDGLWQDVQALPANAEAWDLLLGLNAQTRSQTLAFLETGKVDNLRVRLILNGADPKLRSAADLWNARRVSAILGAEQLGANEIRRCTTVQAIGESLSAYRETPLAPSSYRRMVKMALTSPARYNRAPQNLRDLPEPLVALPLGSC